MSIGKLYGITHSLAGDPIVREPKILKVGIGCSKGPAIYVQIKDGRWFVVCGYKKRGGNAKPEELVTAFPCRDRAHAEARYAELKPQVVTCPFPRKLDFFTFTRQTADGSFEPDFEAIEKHGEKPGRIDLVFFDDDPFLPEYQMWGSSELKCHGDGMNAERVLAMAKGQEESLLAQAAKQNGNRYFPIIEGCATKNCGYAQETKGARGMDPAACKPHADLKFQLAKNLRLGGTSYFSTTGRRSISQIFSCLYRFKTVTGGGDPNRGFLTGIPFSMVLKPFKTNHNGQVGLAYGVSLEFRAESVDALLDGMVKQGLKFRQFALGSAPLQIEGPKAQTTSLPVEHGNDSPSDVVDPGADEAMAAIAYDAEFVSTGDEGEDEDIPESLKDAHQGTAEEKKAIIEAKIAEAQKEADLPKTPVEATPAAEKPTLKAEPNPPVVRVEPTGPLSPDPLPVYNPETLPDPFTQREGAECLYDAGTGSPEKRRVELVDGELVWQIVKISQSSVRRKQVKLASGGLENDAARGYTTRYSISR